MSEVKQVTLVTGASGFLGRHLCRRLQAEGEHVRACGRQVQEGPWQEFVQLDLTGSIDKGIFKDVSTVFHLAGKAHAFRQSSDASDGYDDIIVGGTRRLVEAISGTAVRTFIFISTVKAMGEGNPGKLPLSAIDESWPFRPVTPYGSAKARAEAIVLNSTILHKVILRPAMIFGPGNKGNLLRMREAISKSRFPPIPETGNKRSMIHVDDVVEFAIRSAQFPIANGKSYILASCEPVSTRDLYDWIRSSLGYSRRTWSIPMWMLLTVASLGTLFGRLTGKQLPFDMETLEKLAGSAWYSSALAQKELGHVPMHEVRQWLLSSVDNPFE